MKKDITICTPFYNEELGLKKYFYSLEKIVELLDKKVEFNFLFIDDGSNDNTLKILEDYQLRNKQFNIQIHKHNKNYGYGATLINSINLSKTRYLVTYDADCVYDYKIIDKFLELISKEDYDIINVSYKLSKEKILNASYYRQFLSWCCSIIYKAVFKETRRYNVDVLTCSYRIYKLENIKKIKLLSNDFSCISELMIKAMKNKLKILEIPGAHLDREYGLSKMRIIKNIYNHLKSIFFLMFNR